MKLETNNREGVGENCKHLEDKETFFKKSIGKIRNREKQ